MRIVFCCCSVVDQSFVYKSVAMQSVRVSERVVLSNDETSKILKNFISNYDSTSSSFGINRGGSSSNPSGSEDSATTGGAKVPEETLFQLKIIKEMLKSNQMLPH